MPLSRVAGAALVAALAATLSAAAPDRPRRDLAATLDARLARHVVEPRYPAAIDRSTWGFHSRFTRDWTPRPEGTRFLVHQARVAWTAAFVARRRPALRARVEPAIAPGFAALERFRDREEGGYFARVDLAGRPVGSDGKALHVQAFALLALAELSRAPSLAPADRAVARARAAELFAWIEAVRRPGRSAYPSARARDGQPVAPTGSAVAPVRDGLGVPSDWSDLGTQLHLLEAFSAWQRASPDPRVTARIESLVDLLLDRYWSSPGTLHGALDEGDRPVPMRISFGHALEVAALLVEAAETLGRPDDPRILASSARLIDYAVEWGFDPRSGAWATWAPAVLARSRDRAVGYWVPFEAMHALARLDRRAPSRAGRDLETLAATLDFVDRRLLDDEQGGHWEGLDRRGRTMPTKSGDWIGPYHAARALVVAADELRALR